METIVFILVGSFLVFIYVQINTPSDKQVQEQNEVERQKKIEFENYLADEVVFKQFRNFIEMTFYRKAENNEIVEISKKDMLNEISYEFKGYKTGNPNDLLRDLYRHGLLENGFKHDFYTLGSSFRDLRFVFPDFLEFLIDKCRSNSGNPEFSHSINLKKPVRKAEICKTIDSRVSVTYFYFGILSNDMHFAEFRESIENVEEYNFKFFTKMIRKSKTPNSNSGEVELLYFDTEEIIKYQTWNKFENLLQKWLAKSSTFIQ